VHIYINNKFISYNNYKAKCAVGKRGISIKKKEGDFITPKGTFKIREIFYRKDRVQNLITRIKKTVIRKNMGWCDDPKSKKYNKLIYFPFKHSAEKLYRRENIYDIILVLNFNMNPVKKNKGSAIFIHVAKKNFQPTQGCIALDKSELIKLVKSIKINTIVKII
tara:strand:+ start:603 stop:1094 length:492 start_codon:yes stop_codon:yes gene_type:complete